MQLSICSSCHCWEGLQVSRTCVWCQVCCLMVWCIVAVSLVWRDWCVLYQIVSQVVRITLASISFFICSHVTHITSIIIIIIIEQYFLAACSWIVASHRYPMTELRCCHCCCVWYLTWNFLAVAAILVCAFMDRSDNMHHLDIHVLVELWMRKYTFLHHYSSFNYYLLQFTFTITIQCNKYNTIQSITIHLFRRFPDVFVCPSGDDCNSKTFRLVKGTDLCSDLQEVWCHHHRHHHHHHHHHTSDHLQSATISHSDQRCRTWVIVCYVQYYHI